MAIFDPGDGGGECWPDWREPDHPVAALDRLEDEPITELTPPELESVENAYCSSQTVSNSSVLIRDSVINPRQKPPSEDEGKPATDTPCTPSNYNPSRKEIDQNDSPKLLVLIDTRFPEGEPDGNNENGREGGEDWTTENISPIQKLDSNPEMWSGDGSPLLKSSRAGHSSQVSNSTLLNCGRSSDVQSCETFDSSPDHKASREEPKEDGECVREHGAVPTQECFLEESDSDPSGGDLQTSDSDRTSSDGEPILNLEENSLEAALSSHPKSILRSRKACIKPGGVKLRFSTITTFYFGRQQGWIGVPREGGNTLGELWFYNRGVSWPSLQVFIIFTILAIQGKRDEEKNYRIVKCLP